MIESMSEPTIVNVLLLSLLLIVSGSIILATLRKFKMRVASSLFSCLLFIIGAYIPFYFLGTLVMNASILGDTSSFTFFFLQEQLELLNAPFALFETVSLFAGLIAMLAIIALIILTVFVVKIIIKAVSKARSISFYNARAIKCRFVCHTFIPNYHNTYLVTRRLRN